MSEIKKNKKASKTVSLHSRQIFKKGKNEPKMSTISVSKRDNSLVGGVVSVCLEQTKAQRIRLIKKSIHSMNQSASRHIKIFVAGGEYIDEKVVQANIISRKSIK